MATMCGMEHINAPIAPMACAVATSAGAWLHAATLTPPSAQPGVLGHAVAWLGTRLVAGPARDQDLGKGPAVISVTGPFTPSEGWTTIGEPSGSRGAGFGQALAAAQGICVVGSPHAGCGERGCDTGQAHLACVDDDGSASLVEVPCPGPEVASQYGAAVATDGHWVAIGAPRADAGAFDAGAVDLFEVQPSAHPGRHGAAHASDIGCVRRTVRHVARLRSPEPAISARFGSAIAVDGAWIVVGEPGAGPGTPRAGAAHAYALRDGRWQFIQTLRAPAGAVGGHGASVALAGAELVAGAPFARPHGEAGPRCGAVVRWRRSGDDWQPIHVLSPAPADDPRHGDGFGSAVALGDGWAFAGAPGDDLLGEDAGCAWAVDLRSGRPERLLPEHAGTGDGVGAGLAWTSGPRPTLAVAGRADPERPLVPGAIELFEPAGPRPLRFSRTHRRRGRSPCPHPPSPTRHSHR
jgi:hypothetical protein